MTSELFMVFDVESIGLHGDGFAFGYVVVDRTDREIAAGCFACPPPAASGTSANREWVAANVDLSCIKGNVGCVYERPRDVRDQFWTIWQAYKAQGATLWADCCWPVEARFLATCVDDSPTEREREGPYPLHDVATLRLAAGFDPLATVERLPNELPQHDPLADSRQSARLLIEALRATAA